MCVCGVCVWCVCVCVCVVCVCVVYVCVCGDGREVECVYEPQVTEVTFKEDRETQRARG